MRSGPSGFLLDGATFELLTNEARLPAVAQPLFPAPVISDQTWQPPQSQEVTVPVQPVAEPPRDNTGELFTRITELLKLVDDTKAERDKLELEKADALQRLSESETVVIGKMKEAEELRGELETARKEAFFSKEELGEAMKNLAQAKDMWMKESTRATRLREQLDKSELALAEQSKERSKFDDKYKRTETENANLKHLLSKSNEVVSTQILTPQTVDNSFPASDSYFVRGVSSLTASLEPSHEAAIRSQLSSKFLQLSVNNDGVLFEDEVVQIGIKARFTGLGEGVLGVYFGNKTSGILQNIQAKYTLDSCGSGLHLTASPLPSQLGPKSQVCQRVSAQISASFIDCPRLTVSFLLPDNTPKTVPLRLPVLMNKFMQGRDLLVEEFFSNWRQQLFLLNEASAVINVSMNLVQIARASQLGGALTLHHKIDDVADNLVLAGQFPSDSPEGIRCATIPEALVLVRVEVGTASNAGKARVAVRSNDALVAEALRSCLVQQLSSPLNP